jgi:hypothetical protein
MSRRRGEDLEEEEVELKKRYELLRQKKVIQNTIDIYSLNIIFNIIFALN